MMTEVLRKKLTSAIEPNEIPLLMVCVKLSRLVNTPNHVDSLTDIAGYAETAAMVADVLIGGDYEAS